MRGQKLEENNKALSKTKNNFRDSKTESLNKLLGKNYLKKKLQEQKSFNQSISIVDFTTFNSIIAVVLSSVDSEFISSSENDESI